MDYQKELIAEYDRETAKTRRMIEAIPEGADLDFKPHEKSMTLGRLAGHLTDMAGGWAITTLTQDELKYAADHKWDPFIPKSKQEVLAKFDEGLPKARKALAEMKPDDWDKHWKFIFGDQVWIDQPRHQVFREMVISHMIHHRAQLSVYLRLLNAKVPGLYGPSADEM